MSGLKVLALLGQLKHSRVDNNQTMIIAKELSKDGILYKKEVFFNILINLPSFMLSVIPVWMLIKRMDDFKEINECDAIVVSGKKMIRFARHIRHYMFPNTKIIQIRSPFCKIRQNDILIREATSKYVFTQKNTITINGLLCDKIDNEVADAESKKFDKIKQIFNGDYIGVFIGQDRTGHRFDPYSAEKFAKIISKIAYNMKMNLLICVDGKISKNSLEVFKKNLDCSYYFYEKDKQVDSPKVAFMHWAKYFIMCGTNINEQSEYMAQMKPNYVYLTPISKKRYMQFISIAFSKGSARQLTDVMETLDDYQPTSMNDIAQVVESIKKML